ncbi:MAG: 4Fe-4S binding protein [Thermoplasmata archaeon]|nr:4Fe-4S binding protein [Thermoplasmata archaeon]
MARPGYMIPELLGRLGKKPVTVLYPYEKLPTAPGLRGKIKFHTDKCIGCGMCARDCPSGACVMVEFKGEGRKKSPEFNLDRCTFCEQCAESCPKDAIELTGEYELAHFKKNELIIR